MTQKKQHGPVTWLIGCLACLMMLAAMPAAGRAEAEREDEPAEWTVLFYLCGSDLESRFGYATGNLAEIAGVQSPEYDPAALAQLYGEAMDRFAPDRPGKVNVLIQTGGAKEWHAGELGMDISAEALQRWRFEPRSGEAEAGSFLLEQELPLASMADPETLTAFIRWGISTCPAKKVALVLWDHGGGSQTGIFIDELFREDVMRLSELRTALQDSGAAMEALLFDACLMANVETAAAIQDSARWMIASEEVVAGKGTAIGEWLQQLYYDPECDGERLGRWICDMSQIKYTEENDAQTQALLTWSLIDLQAIPRLTTAFDRFFEMLGQAYARSPRLLAEYTGCIREAEEYGSGQENMFDIAGIFYHPDVSALMDRALRREMLDALAETVIYSVRGAGRSAARGISFCYAVDFSQSELDVYAVNCPFPHYLALLDAISPWSAPEWAYETAEHLPEIETNEAYRIDVIKRLRFDGTPGFTLVDGDRSKLSAVRYLLFREDPRSEQVVSLGMAPAYYDRKEQMYCSYDLWLWPAIEGELCSLEVLNMPKEGTYNTLFNIPVRIDTDLWNLRCSYNYGPDDYTVYGIWEGYDSDSEMFNRNVKDLARMAGQDFRLLYPLDDGTLFPSTGYATGKVQPLYRSLAVEEIDLPAGIYYIQYIAYDLFMRPMPLNRVKLHWDGENMRFDEASWQGEATLAIPDYYW